jgi:hypothetical protein
MKNLTDNQINFLLEYFFENEKYAGWKNIATELLKNGSCIVAGTECIWIGGIGNFIKTEKAEKYIGCILYTFDLEYFLSSEYYKEISNNYILNNVEIIKEKGQIINEIKQLGQNPPLLIFIS